MTLDEFQLVAKDRRRESGKRPKRYSAEEREFATTFATEQQAAGVGMSRICDQLGVSFGTLKKWLGPSECANGFRRVKLKAERRAGGIALVTPRGFRVEGLDLETAVTLLGKLG